MIGTTLKSLLEERGMTVSELSRAAGVPAQTLYSIIKRDNMKIDFDVLLKICKALYVPVEQFYKDYTDPELSPSLPSPAEWEILRKYRSLDAHGQEMARIVMEAEARRIEEESRQKEEPEYRVIPLFYTPAAAGYASPALGEDYEEYMVPASCKADFAARIQGDSMEPYIKDGSIVLVSRGAELSDGDVGLFFVDGDMKCKQYCEDSYGNIYLFSLNRKRKDADVFIPASSGVTVCCFGKVLLDRRPPLPTD